MRREVEPDDLALERRLCLQGVAPCCFERAPQQRHCGQRVPGEATSIRVVQHGVAALRRDELRGFSFDENEAGNVLDFELLRQFGLEI